MVKNLIHVQESYINSYHPDFMGGANSIMTFFDPEQFQKKQEETNKGPERMNIGPISSSG